MVCSYNVVVYLGTAGVEAADKMTFVPYSPITYNTDVVGFGLTDMVRGTEVPLNP